MTMSPPLPTHFAAIDLGSNSFHMLISEWGNGQLIEVARQKVMVQIARGIDKEHNLSTEALERARVCLEEFKTLLQQYPNTIVRTIGTQALRQCNNLPQFLGMAEPILGSPIEIISGQQEASYVYQGVQHSLPLEHRQSPILVVDIGGASTELIIGQGTHISHWHSFTLGCVDLANRFFPNKRQSPIRQEYLEQAYRYSCEQLSPLQSKFGASGWQQAMGASGTMRVILDLLPADSNAVIHRQRLEQLLNDLNSQGELSDIIPDSLRWDVLPAGLALLMAIFDTYSMEQLTVSKGSIKEGVLLSTIREQTHKGDKIAQ